MASIYLLFLIKIDHLINLYNPYLQRLLIKNLQLYAFLNEH